jgi:hypothetical protein
MYSDDINTTELRGKMDNTPDTYSGGLGFKCRTGV